MTEVWIVQPYVPSYRVPFFEGLIDSLAMAGVTLRVVAGRPDASQAQRDDSSTPTWLTRADDRILRAFGRSVTLTWTRQYWGRADAVIVPHMGSSLDALSALAYRSGPKVGVWGHIASYTARPHPVDAQVERWQLRRAHHVFAYTPSGAEFAIKSGARAENVTTVMNAIDTATLQRDLDRIDARALGTYRDEESLPDGPIITYLGALDSSKRIDFLAATLDILWVEHPEVHVLVGGQGKDAHLLDPAVQRRQATLIGYVTGERKAKLMKSSLAIANPGRVGLLAVDALVAGIPIVSTRWDYHAPEIEYLTQGESLFLSEDDPAQFAALLAEVAAARFGSAASRWRYPTMEGMVSNFHRGIERLLEHEG